MICTSQEESELETDSSSWLAVEGQRETSCIDRKVSVGGSTLI